MAKKIYELNDDDKEKVFLVLLAKDDKETNKIIGHLDQEKRLDILQAAAEYAIGDEPDDF